MCIFVLRGGGGGGGGGGSYHFRGNFSSKMATFCARNTNICKICKLHRAIFSVFYKISPPSFAIFPTLRSFLAVAKDFVLPACLVRALVFYANCPFLTLGFLKVLKRILSSMVPVRRRNYLATQIRSNPDLYGKS